MKVFNPDQYRQALQDVRRHHPDPKMNVIESALEIASRTQICEVFATMAAPERRDDPEQYRAWFKEALIAQIAPLIAERGDLFFQEEGDKMTVTLMIVRRQL